MFDYFKKKKKKKPFFEIEKEDLYDVHRNSDIPITEKRVKQKKVKR